MLLCDYGCGKESLYQLKNGKWCCSKSQNSCLKVRESLVKAQKESWSRLELREKFSKIMKEVSSRPEVKNSRSKIMKRNWAKPELKNIMSHSSGNSWKNKTNDEKAEICSKIFKSNERKPNKVEIFTNNLIQLAKPNEFSYCGDGKVWIAGKCPDWININGKKKVIEYFSNYWHKKEDEEVRKSHFRKYGFKCLVIWENELKDKSLLIEKIKSF